MIGEEYVFKRPNGDSIRGIRWPNPQSKSLLIIVTGMEEHASRYEHFAASFLELGFEVFCLDHFGQGANARDEKQRGVWPVGAFETTVDVVSELIDKVKNDRPVYLFGHSLGSFISQRFIQKYGNKLEKVVLCGTNGPDKMVKIGFMLANLIVGKRGYQKKSKLFNDMVFGAYAKSIPNAKTPFDWLSYNEENVTKYIEDPYCGYGSTGGFYKEFLRGLSKLFKKSELEKIPKELPILLIAGAEDPVGNHGNGVHELEGIYRALGIKTVRKIIYEHMRHEILNEIDRHLVYQDVTNFLK